MFPHRKKFKGPSKLTYFEHYFGDSMAMRINITLVLHFQTYIETTYVSVPDASSIFKPPNVVQLNVKMRLHYTYRPTCVWTIHY